MHSLAASIRAAIAKNRAEDHALKVWIDDAFRGIAPRIDDPSPNEWDALLAGLPTLAANDDHLDDDDLAAIATLDRVDLDDLTDDDLAALADLDRKPLPARRRRDNITNAKRPKSDRQDRKTLRTFKDLEVRVPCVATTVPSVASTHLPPITPTTPVASSTTSHTLSHDNDDTLPTWRNTGERVKVTMANRALSIHGTSYAFSLHLSDDVIAKATACERGAADYVGQRIARELRQITGEAIPFLSVLEISPGGRLHVHGGFALPHGMKPAAVAGALRRAGGPWGASNNFRQVDVTRQTNADGWASYSLKDRGKTRQEVDGRLVFASKALQREARNLYEEARQKKISHR